MPDSSRDAGKELATEEASLWLEKLERTLQQGESARLREWLAVPLHRRVIVERCMLWHGPEVLGVLGKLIPIDARLGRAEPFSRRMGTLLGGVLAVGCATLATMVLVLWMRTLSSNALLLVNEVYDTAVGARQDVRLPDGSTIQLNTATRLAVSYGLRSRDVTLLAGEAGFVVAPDATRLFRLHVGPRSLEIAAGRLALRRRAAEEADVTVAEGEAKILRSQHYAVRTPAQRRNALSYDYGETTLHAGQGAVVGPDWQWVQELQPGEMRSRLAWQQGLIAFASEPLEDALAEIERYTDERFVFADEALRRVRVSAEFRTGDVEDVRRVLREKLAIDSRPEAGGRIVLGALRR